MTEEVQVLKVYNEKWLNKVIKKKKWKERCELLKEMFAICSKPKLTSGDYFPLIAPIKLLLKDKHANVIALIIKIVGLLAKGLRDRFSNEAKILTEHILIKLKDKNKAIERAAKSTLENLFYSYKLSAGVLETYLDALKEKAPKMKINILYTMENYFLKI